MNRTAVFPARRPSLILVYAALLLTVITLFIRCPQLFSRIVSPVQVQQEEAVNVEFGRLLKTGQNLYPDITQGGPYLHCSYPPLFPFLESRLSNVVSGLWLPGRLLALIGFLGCVLLLLVVGWKRWRNNSLVVLLPFLLWLNPTWEAWGSMVRLDCLLYLFNFIAFLILLRRTENKKATGYMDLASAGLLNSAAIFMKPTALTLLLAFALWALSQRKFKELICFAVASLSPFLIFVVWAQVTTHGMYWKDTMSWAAVGFSWDRMEDFVFNSFFKEVGWLAVLVVLAFFFKKLPGFLKLQLMFSVLSLWTLCRDGSAENYYMEFILYGLFTVGEGWAGKDNEFGSKKSDWLDWSLGLLLIWGAVTFFLFPGPHVPNADEINMKRTASKMYGQGDYHLAIDTDLPLMEGKPIYYQHSGILAIVQAGVWDPAPLIHDIQNHKFTTVEFYDIPHQYLYPPVVEQAILDNYRPQWKSFGRVWYVPKS